MFGNYYNTNQIEYVKILKNNLEEKRYITEEIEDEIIKNISLKFKIIEFWKADITKIDYNKGKIKKTKIEVNKSFKAPKNKHYHTSDIHGDLNVFLYSVLKSGCAKYKDGENPEIFYDISSRKTFKTIEEAIKKSEKFNIFNIRVIANIEPNPNFDGIFTFGGDLIDRGLQSEETFYSMMHLLKQNSDLGINRKNIQYILGNHEKMVLDKNFQLASINGSNYLLDTKSDLTRNKIEKGKNEENFTRNKDNFVFMFLHLNQAIVDSNVNLSYALNNQTIVSHVVYDKNTINSLLDFMEDESVINNFHHKNFLTIARSNKENLYYKLIDKESYEAIKTQYKKDLMHISQLKTKIQHNIELNQIDITNLSNVINTFNKLYFLNNKDRKLVERNQRFAEMSKNILWQRSLNGGKEIKNSYTPIPGLNQIVGHDKIESHRAILENSKTVLHTDFNQSSGYNSGY